MVDIAEEDDAAVPLPAPDEAQDARVNTPAAARSARAGVLREGFIVSRRELRKEKDGTGLTGPWRRRSS
jgi:tRNA U34 5-methylaminomethyl-2-thiouridine-forming methyltransferase MnmC